MRKSCAGTLLMFRPRRPIAFLITHWAVSRPLELGELHRRRSEQPAAWQPAGLQYPFLAYRLMTAYHTITPPTSFSRTCNLPLTGSGGLAILIRAQ